MYYHTSYCLTRSWGEMHCVTPRAFRAFPKGLQGGTLPWGSLWERKRSLASQLPLMSFLVGGILPYGKLTPHTLGSSVAAWESGTMPQKVIFPKSKIGGVLVHGRDTDQETEEEELEGIWEGAECYCVVFDQFLKKNYFLPKQTLWGNLRWFCFYKLRPEAEFTHWCRFPFWC